MATHNPFSIAISHVFEYLWRNKMHMKVIGREAAKVELDRKMKSEQAELIAIMGRRRVGKTFLIKHYLEDEMIFHFTGLYNSNLREHLERFTQHLSVRMGLATTLSTPKSWFEAFDLLRSYIINHKSRKKKVIFLDEFPWLATNRSRFLTAFTDFWNSFAVDRTDVVVIICGSSASWMIKKVLRNKGGLHNRVTGRIFLEPFNLYETKLLLRKKHVMLNDMDIVRLYMAVGGIPYYIDQIGKGESFTQAIDRICFAKGAILRMEYDEILASLFNHSEKHKAIIESLNSHPKGMLRAALIQKTGLNSGGGTSGILEELEVSGFISSEVPYGKKNRDKIYKLKDYYMLFYLKYIRDAKPGVNKYWEKLSTMPTYKSWSGLAFENVCLQHIDQIKKALKIDGIISTAGAWHSKANDEMQGAQIDLLIDRADGIINICEIKFSDAPYTITAEYAKKLRLRLASFKYFTKTKKALFPTMITSYGVNDNIHSTGFIQQSVEVNALFQPA